MRKANAVACLLQAGRGTFASHSPPSTQCTYNDLRPQSDTISRVPDALIRDVVCEHCSRRTPQRLSTLEPILWLQATSSENGIYINYACPLCNKLSRSRLGAGKSPQDAEAAKLLDELAVYIVFLKCANADCESPVVLLAPVKNGVRDADLMAHIRENWSNHGAACAKGHRPAHPYEARIWKPLDSQP